MDLERIKQNFRTRSGRNKQQKKRSKPAADKHPEDSQVPNGGNSESGAPEADPEAAPVQEDHTETLDQDDKKQHHSEELESTQNGDAHVDGETSASNEQEARQPEDIQPELIAQVEMADPKGAEPSSEAEDFDLNPPEPREKPPSLEDVSELLFSSGHLDCLLHQPLQLARFSGFLQKYIPQHYPLLAQYLETQKAIKAIAYANAIAEGLKPQDTGRGTTTETRTQAASLDQEFQELSNASFKALVGDALPTYVSYNLVKMASECLTNEITGKSTSVMRELVGGLSEVFCLTDPNRKDNPIIYASEEFYRLTRYGPDEVLNHNCRFLQGRKTNPDSPKRLKDAIEKGEEISETLLNYRRDGRPFINLLMVAPLHDRHKKVKYQIGAQVDVTGLVEGGRALPGFQRYLNRRAEDKKREELEQRRQELQGDQQRKKRVLTRLRDLSESFDLEESAVVQANSRSNSLTREDDDDRSIGSVERQQRRVYGQDEASEGDDEDGTQEQGNTEDWKLGSIGDGRLSGKLPGVYDSFMLLRPAPSLRIVFVSPKLQRIGDVLQTPFLSHVAAPSNTITGLAESLKSGVPVSAKIHFTPQRGENRDGTILKSGVKHEDGKNGRAIWVSCTPLLGDDDRVGVWMCVVVEKSKIGSVSKRGQTPAGEAVRSTENNESPRGRARSAGLPNGSSSQAQLDEEETPIKPVRIGSQTRFTKTDEQEESEAATPEKNRSAKSIRPMESIYFDAEGGQNPVAPKPDEASNSQFQETHQADESHHDSRSQTLQTPDRHPRAVVSPVAEYEEPPKDPKAYSVQVPSLASPRATSTDEYVDSHHPTTPAQQNERVVIEDDSDGYAEEDVKHNRENLKVGSEDRGRPEKSRSPSAAQEATSDREISKVSAETPQEEASSGDTESLTTEEQQSEATVGDADAATTSGQEGTASDHDVEEVPAGEQKEAVSNEDVGTAQSALGDLSQSLDGLTKKSHDSSVEKEVPDNPAKDTASSPEQEPEPENKQSSDLNAAQHQDNASSDDGQISTTPPRDQSQSTDNESDKLDAEQQEEKPLSEDDHKSQGPLHKNPGSLDDKSNDADAEQSDDDHLADSQVTLRNASQDREQEWDSAISMGTPERKRTKSRSQSRTPRQNSSPSISPAKQAQDPEGDGHAASDEEVAEHEQYVEGWVQDARPPSSHPNEGGRVKMDYLRAGARWSRPQALGGDRMAQAQANEDRMTDFENCARSPYSVD